MTRALIKPSKCLACKVCAVAQFCPHTAVIREEATDKPWIDFLLCTGCRKCKDICPGRALEYIVQPCSGGRRMSW
ncbi:MAG: 4Fe-4S binding protein [Kiritimatiellae bacterium]|nr:4Fe-4S binding protein [Kiritimatiellia bacterium]